MKMLKLETKIVLIFFLSVIPFVILSELVAHKVGFYHAYQASAIILAVPLALMWWPSHVFFKWLRMKHKSMTTFQFSVIGCTLMSIALIAIAIKVGNHFTDPRIRSLDSSANQNMWWLPAGLLVLGIWAGFLSGYMKMKTGIFDKIEF